MRRGVVIVLAALVASACAASGSTAETSSTGAAAYSFRSILSASDPVHVSAPANKPGWLYVVEQAGRIRIAVNGRYRSAPFLDIRRLVRSGGSRASCPSRSTRSSRRTGASSSTTPTLNGNTRVVEYRSNAAGTQALTRTRKQWLFVAQPYENHNGGQLAFGPDGRLYVGMGDGGSGGDPQNRAQNMGTLLGKLVRINVAVSKPNPQIAALGTRNPWRFSFDRANGDLYMADVGQNAWEEIDWVPRARWRSSRTSAGTRTRDARGSSRRNRTRAGDSCFRSMSTGAATGARSRAASSIAGRRCPRPGVATSSGTTAAGRSGRS